MGGYRELDMRITPDLPPRPDGPYGATKLMGERLGRSMAHAFDMTFIALRLGSVQRGLNRADTLPDDWARAMWLSNRDLARLFDAAVEAELPDRDFVVVNGMSNNPAPAGTSTPPPSCSASTPRTTPIPRSLRRNGPPGAVGYNGEIILSPGGSPRLPRRGVRCADRVRGGRKWPDCGPSQDMSLL